eukprot:TRINITY_DN25938_c0_g1_i1.p2 TRINITY_DN25938_c0_g1~~TRINITY_DN25938_c0_g1_i1.p2  ORF type:complete len:502 (+),score=115.62 TRINITY_DN25938_c0_g1_i1:115-1620(+)
MLQVWQLLAVPACLILGAWLWGALQCRGAGGLRVALRRAGLLPSWPAAAAADRGPASPPRDPRCPAAPERRPACRERRAAPAPAQSPPPTRPSPPGCLPQAPPPAERGQGPAAPAAAPPPEGRQSAADAAAAAAAAATCAAAAASPARAGGLGGAGSPLPGAQLFGIEAEFVVPRLADVWFDGAAMAAVRVLPALRRACPGEVIRYEPRFEKEGQRYEDWVLTKDGSIQQDARVGPSLGFELISPKLPFGRSSLQRARAMVGALAEAGAVANHSTGLHVHVSIAQVGEVGVARLAACFVYFEDAFDALCCPTRRRDCCQHARSLRKSVFEVLTGGSAATMFSSARPPGIEIVNDLDESDVAALSRAVLAAPPESALLLVNPMTTPIHQSTRYHKLNFAHCKLHPCGDPERRVEFRQHEGTTDAAEIAHWVQLCVGFTEAAATWDPPPAGGSGTVEELLFAALPEDAEARAHFLAKRAALPAKVSGFVWTAREFFACEYSPV